uniref:Headcase middle domain-containing protein n=1 Tax=Oryctolagus cuniculus TaxID=9986 RepID=G1TK20_RABIT
MEDDAQVGQGEDLRKFILAALSASHRNVVNCALCHRALPVFEQFPLVDGTLFLSPSRHDEIEYDVPCHLQGRLMHLYAVCVDCLEGVHKIICIKCKSRWDGSWHQLGTMYTYDILAASPCCQVGIDPLQEQRVIVAFCLQVNLVELEASLGLGEDASKRRNAVVMLP